MKRPGQILDNSDVGKRYKTDLCALMQEAKKRAAAIRYDEYDGSFSIEPNPDIKEMMRESKKRLKDPLYRLSIEKKLDDYLKGIPDKQKLKESDKGSKISGKESDKGSKIGGKLTFELDHQDGMQVSLKFLSGRTCPLKVCPSDTVKEVKAKIQAQIGIPTDQQHLMFAGKQLDDDRTLENQNVKPDSEIVLVPTLTAAADDADVFVILGENSNPNIVNHIMTEAKNKQLKVCFDYSAKDSIPKISKKVDDLQDQMAAQETRTDKKIKENFGALASRFSKVEEKVDQISISSNKKVKKHGKHGRN